MVAALKNGDIQSHWNWIYSSKDETAVSWYEKTPEQSLAAIKALKLDNRAAIIDIGCGMSDLAGHLLGDGFQNISVLDVSRVALDALQKRLKERAACTETSTDTPAKESAGAFGVKAICSDITNWQPASRYDLWHDRAVLHFLRETKDKQAYHRALLAATRPGSHVILSTFALDGPQTCSGLKVCRYDYEKMETFLGHAFDIKSHCTIEHITPGGTPQLFFMVTAERFAENGSATAAG